MDGVGAEVWQDRRQTEKGRQNPGDADAENREELLADWERARDLEPLERIDPLP